MYVRFVHTLAMEQNRLSLHLSERGRKIEFARSLGVSKQTVSDWLRSGVVSSDYAARASVLTGIPKEVLCPGFDWGSGFPVQDVDVQKLSVPIKRERDSLNKPTPDTLPTIHERKAGVLTLGERATSKAA